MLSFPCRWIYRGRERTNAPSQDPDVSPPGRPSGSLSPFLLPPPKRPSNLCLPNPHRCGILNSPASGSRRPDCCRVGKQPRKTSSRRSPANLRCTKRRKWSILWVGRIRPPLRDFRPHNTPPGPSVRRAGKQEAFPSPMTI